MLEEWIKITYVKHLTYYQYRDHQIAINWLVDWLIHLFNVSRAQYVQDSLLSVGDITSKKSWCLPSIISYCRFFFFFKSGVYENLGCGYINLVQWTEIRSRIILCSVLMSILSLDTQWDLCSGQYLPSILLIWVTEHRFASLSSHGLDGVHLTTWHQRWTCDRGGPIKILKSIHFPLGQQNV